MAYQRISGTAASVSKVANTVVIGPISLEDPVSILLVAKTGASGATTPTNPKLQQDCLGNGNWVDIPSGAVTVSTSANTLAMIQVNTIIAAQIRVVAAGTFGAGDATLELRGSSF